MMSFCFAVTSLVTKTTSILTPRIFPLSGKKACAGRGGESQEGDGEGVAETCSTQGLTC